MKVKYTNKSYYTILGMLLTVILQAQSPVRISSEYDENREEYTIFGINDSEKSQTLILMIEQMDGVVPSRKLPVISTIFPREIKRLIKLERIGTATPRFSTTYRYFNGVANPDINEEVRYLLPMSNGLTTQVFLAKSLEEIVQSGKVSENEEMYSLTFKLVDGDTICAARSGVVEDVKQTGQSDLVNYSFSKSRNFINIRHRDGTIARYVQFKNETAMVQPGDQVLAGTPLAIAVQSNTLGEANLLFSVTYLEVDVDKMKVPGEWYDVKYVKPIFTTTDYEGVLEEATEYSVFLSEDLVLQEMSKREKKKYHKGNY